MCPFPKNKHTKKNKKKNTQKYISVADQTQRAARVPLSLWHSWTHFLLCLESKIKPSANFVMSDKPIREMSLGRGVRCITETELKGNRWLEYCMSLCLAGPLPEKYSTLTQICPVCQHKPTLNTGDPPFKKKKRKKKKKLCALKCWMGCSWLRTAKNLIFMSWSLFLTLWQTDTTLQSTGTGLGKGLSVNTDHGLQEKERTTEHEKEQLAHVKPTAVWPGIYLQFDYLTHLTYPIFFGDIHDRCAKWTQVMCVSHDAFTYMLLTASRPNVAMHLLGSNLFAHPHFCFYYKRTFKKEKKRSLPEFL